MTNAFRPSAACCSTPAVIGPPYEPKGKFINIDGYETYITGPASAAKALFVLYDVFGYSSQILEGADKLAEHYFVFMPSFFGNKPAPLDWMPVDGQEEMQKLDEFCEGPGETQKTLRVISSLRSKLQETYPHIESWGLMGYCWGGFVSSYAIGADTPFKACAQVHPGFPSAKIAEQISVPVLALCSKDEPEREYATFKPALKVEHHFIHFPEMVHGWMSARGDLSREDVRRDFDRGYAVVLEWFQEHL